MRITHELHNQTAKAIEQIKANRLDDAINTLAALRTDLEKIEVFTRWKFERNEVVKERSTGYTVKIIGIGHSGDGWGYKVAYTDPMNEPTDENRKPEWRYESEFEKLNRKSETTANVSDIYGNLLNRLRYETREAEISLQEPNRY